MIIQQLIVFFLLLLIIIIIIIILFLLLLIINFLNENSLTFLIMNIAGVQKRYSFAFLMGSITQTANPSPPSLKVSLTHGKIWSGVKYIFYFKYIKRNKRK